MTFFLPRMAVALLTPLNVSLLLLTISLALLLCNRKWSSFTFILVAVLILMAGGYGVFSKQLITDQEGIHVPVTESSLLEIKKADVRYIVVLGSGHISDSRLPVTSQIGTSSLYRLVEGVRIHRELPQSTLIISGGRGYDPLPNAVIVSEVARCIGVPADEIIVESRPRDTLQEAEMVFQYVLKNEFILVTSAMHMPRAMKIFQDLGMNPIPAPTDYIVKKQTTKTAASLLPEASNLNLYNHIIYEWVGSKWIQITRFIENYQ